jgi:hypothetical protein
MTDSALIRFEELISHYNDDSYFFLVRNYLGPVKTPFHKPQLTTALVNFFNQESIQERMLDLLDEMDLTILSLLQLTGSVDSETIIDLLSPFYSYPKLLIRLSNLQQRLILLSERSHLVFNPLIEEQLVSRCSLDLLADSSDEKGGQYSRPTTEFIRSYLSLIRREERLGFREQYRSIFPAIDGTILSSLFESITEILQTLGVIIPSKPPKIVTARSEALLELDDREMLTLLVAAAGGEGPIAARIALVGELIATLDHLPSIAKDRLILLVRALSKRNQLPSCEAVIPALIRLGIISDGPVHLINTVAERSEREHLLVDSDHTISYLGSSPPGDLLYRFATIETHDVQRRWRVDRSSIVSAFDAGVTLAEIEDYLTKQGRGGAVASLLKQCTLLDERYKAATVHDGLVLVCDERVANLVENLPALKEQCIKCLAPTVYLMRRNTETIWRKALEDAGQLVGATRSLTPVKIIEEASFPSFDHYLEASRQPHPPVALTGGATAAVPTIDTDLEQAIGAASLARGEREDLLGRFAAGLILTKGQITAQILDPIIEAGGFDYQGKVTLCRRAVGHKEKTLQIRLDGEELFAWAVEVNTSSDGAALLKAAILPSRSVRIIPISKIFSIRLIKTLLF